MKLASFGRHGADESFGIVTGDGVIDLRRRTGLRDLKALLEEGLAIAGPFADEAPDHRLDEIVLLPPITDPDHVLAVGLNTRSHLEEAAAFFATEVEEPAYPQLFMRSPSSYVGHGAEIVIPKVSPTLDFEGEIALVIGKPGRYISRDDALSHVAGITCYNDGSVREFQRHSPQVTAAKNFEASGACGPWLVTLDEVGPLEDLTLETRVNGDVQQKLVMDDLFFGFAELIEYVSQPVALVPGDVIVTGSPAGIGAIQGRYLQPGDVVEVSVPGVGTLRNRVSAEE